MKEYQALLDLGFKLTEYQLYDTFKTYTFKNDEEVEIEVSFNLISHGTHYEFHTGQVIESVVIKVLAEIEWSEIDL